MTVAAVLRLVRLAAIALPTPKATAATALTAFFASGVFFPDAFSFARLGFAGVTGSFSVVELLVEVAVFFFPIVFKSLRERLGCNRR